MNKRRLIKAAIAYFIIVNTTYFWQKLPGLWDMAIHLVLSATYLILIAIGVFQIIKLVYEKFTIKERIFSVGTLLIVLTLTALFPRGIIDFSQFEGEDLMIAQRLGVASCTTTIKLKPQNKFIEKSVCFGVDEFKGKYELLGDTIKFKYNNKSLDGEKYAYGILKIKTDSTGQQEGYFLFFRSITEKRSLPMKIKKFELK